MYDAAFALTASPFDPVPPPSTVSTMLPSTVPPPFLYMADPKTCPGICLRGQHVTTPEQAYKAPLFRNQTPPTP
jgi:hypothetical protein